MDTVVEVTDQDNATLGVFTSVEIAKESIKMSYENVRFDGNSATYEHPNGYDAHLSILVRTLHTKPVKI